MLYDEISPDFFATLRVPLLAGREFVDADGPGAPPVAIVNEALARRLWPGDAAPLGRTLLLGGRELRVVGVIANHNLASAAEAAPAMAFVPFWQDLYQPQVDARLAVRVHGDPARALPALRRAIARADPAVPVTEALPMTTQVGAQFVELHLGGSVLVVTAGLALFLCGVGLYAMIAFLVAQRTREIGIRLAIGAPAGRVVALFLRQGLPPLLFGTAAGLVAALAGARLLPGWLFGVRPLDAVAFGTAAAVTVVVSLLATYLPARRAARVDPVIALRSE